VWQSISVAGAIANTAEGRPPATAKRGRSAVSFDAEGPARGSDYTAYTVG